MIDREDMMELTRRMTNSRTSFTRIAGAYVEEGEIDGTFNIHFLKLSPKEKQKYLNIAKCIPFAETNVNLKEYPFPKDARGRESMWQLLRGIKTCGLENDALMETFYELVAEAYKASGDYAVLVFHDLYDIPAKASDKERLGESEEVFEYLICAVCPLVGEYEPGLPECGFLFPAFRDRGSDQSRTYVFQKEEEHPHMELVNVLLGK